MLTYTAMGTCVLVLTLGTILVIVLVIQKEKTGKGVGTALLAALVGILMGAGGAAAGVQLMGYDLAKSSFAQEELADSTGDDMSDEMAGGGMMGMGGGGGGGGRGRSAKRQLTTLVRKIELLTGDIALDLTDEQSNLLVGVLNRIQSAETMTDEEATAWEEELFGLLTQDQTAKQEAVSLPFRRSGGGGRGGMGGGGGGAGGGPDPDANPFGQEQNSEALGSLLQRFGEGEAAANEAATEKTKETAVEESEESATLKSEADAEARATGKPSEPEGNPAERQNSE